MQVNTTLGHALAALREAIVSHDREEGSVEAKRLLAALDFVEEVELPKMPEHYKSTDFVSAIGGPQYFVAALTVQALSGFEDWPHEFEAITQRFRSVLAVPDHTLAYYHAGVAKRTRFTPYG